MHIDQVEIEIGDNLFLRISDVTLTPGRPGRYSGAPEDCYPEDPAEIDWNACRLVKYSGKIESLFQCDDLLSNEYYDELLDQALEDVVNIHFENRMDKPC